MTRLTKGRLLFLLLGLGWLIWSGKSTISAVSLEPEISLLPDGVQVVWHTPELVETVQEDGRITLSLPNFNDDLTASLLLALPPEGEPTLEFSENGVGERPFPPNLSLDPALADLPVLSLAEAGVLRGVRLARLTFRPVQLVDGQLRLTESISATIQFNSPPGFARPAAAAPDLLQTAVAAQIINPGQLAVIPSANSTSRPESADPTIFIEVAKPGITAVTYADLQAAGFPVGSLNPANLQLWYDGQPRPLEWLGDGDAQFEPGESFRFYAAPWFSRWQANDVYTLTAGGSPGSRMQSQAASPDGLNSGLLWLTAVAEQNQIYTPDCLCGLPAGRDGDRWVWEDLRQPGRPSASFTVELPYVNTNQPAQLTVWSIGLTSLSAAPDHHLDLSFNGSGLGRVSWDGKTAVTHTLSLPASSLKASSTLGLTVPVVPGVSIDGVLLDGFSVRYRYSGAPFAASQQQFVQGANARRAYTAALSSSAGLRLYDITNPATPARLTGVVLQGSSVSWGDPDGAGHSYLLTTSSSLHAPAALRLPRSLPPGSADYVVISHASFIPALSPLVNLRQSQGLSVKVVDVQAVYDWFGYGRLTPEAIRSYLSYLYHAATPAPTYVLLVGDGTSDPKQYRPDSQKTWLPPYLAEADPSAGEVAADNRFVTVDGDDLLPDMLIGRLPVNSLAQAQTVVGKIVAYETKPFFGDWNGRVTFISDDADSAGNFAAHSASLAQNYVTDPWQASSLNYNPTQLSEAAMQTQVRQSWQNGTGLLVYTGHSSIHQWGAERFFHLDDVANLSNGGRLPVVLQMTCFTGSFAQPYWDTLDEALLRHPNGGAVAVWGSTGLGVGTGHDALASGFLQSLLVDGEVELGTAVLSGKLNLFTNRPTNLDLLDTFTLFGDPATRYNTDFWPGIPTYLPLISR